MLQLVCSALTTGFDINIFLCTETIYSRFWHAVFNLCEKLAKSFSLWFSFLWHFLFMKSFVGWRFPISVIFLFMAELDCIAWTGWLTGCVFISVQHDVCATFNQMHNKSKAFHVTHTQWKFGLQQFCKELKFICLNLHNLQARVLNDICKELLFVFKFNWNILFNLGRLFII